MNQEEGKNLLDNNNSIDFYYYGIEYRLQKENEPYKKGYLFQEGLDGEPLYPKAFSPLWKSTFHGLRVGDILESVLREEIESSYSDNSFLSE